MFAEQLPKTTILLISLSLTVSAFSQSSDSIGLNPNLLVSRQSHLDFNEAASLPGEQPESATDKLFNQPNYSPSDIAGSQRETSDANFVANEAYKDPLTKRQAPNNEARSLVRSIDQESDSSPPVANVAGSLLNQLSTNSSAGDDICTDHLCYGLPMGCLGSTQTGSSSRNGAAHQSEQTNSGATCSVLVTSKRFVDPNRPISRDILFQLIASKSPNSNDNYAAVGFSETGRMQGLVSECVQFRDSQTQQQKVILKHSFNLPGNYRNVPAKILSGVRDLGSSYENGYYQCRWIVESAVEFSYEALNGSLIYRREDLGYKNYHILLATGGYDSSTDGKYSILKLLQTKLIDAQFSQWY